MDRKKIIILLLIALLISLGIIVVFMQNKSNKAEVIKPIARYDDSNLLTVENKKEKFDIIKIRDNGDDSDKLVIVIMGDGYTSEELGEFGEDSEDAIEVFLDAEPFNNYKKHINVYIINVASNVSGASLNKNEIRDTYFGSCYNNYNIARLLVATKSYRAHDLLKKSKLDYDVGVIIVNNYGYGGSGGDLVVTSKQNIGDTLLHEFGHTYAELADEYPYAENELYSRSEAPNLTMENNIESIKWKSFIGKNGIGIYEMLEGNGGWYKPSRYCRMGSSDIDFCDVCKDEIEKRIVAETMKGTISPDIKSIIDKGK